MVRRDARIALDPYFACLIFAAVGLGTLGLGASPRMIILWVTLLGLWLVYREGKTIRLRYRFADIGRGLGIGLAISVPLMLIAFRGLIAAIPILYVSVKEPAVDTVTGTMIFTSLVFLAPLAEELFFRDMLQRERGFWIAGALYTVAGVILFLPTAGDFPVVLVAVSGSAGVLGILYALLHERYGLTVAIACHATVNLILLCVPATLSHIELFAR